MKMKKILSIALVLILTIGMLAGCGNGTVTSEAEKNFSETDDKLTLKWLSYPILEGCEEGTQAELLVEEKFNVEIEPMFYEYGHFNDKKTMLMASGEIPDLLYELDPINVFNDVDQDFIIEVPYGTIKKYAPSYYQYLNETAPAVWSYSRYMDANWGVPNLNYYNGLGSVSGYRADWLEKIGKDVPTTIDEMHDVLYSFVYDDPDGNGKDDTFGYSMISTAYQFFFTEMFGAYGVLPFDWQEVDGEIVYGGLREECTEVLQILQDWYKEGIIHPDFISGTNVVGLTTASQIGYYQQIAYQNENNPTSLISTLRQAVPEADWAYVSSPYGPDGLRGSRVWGYPCHVVSFGKTEQYGVAVPRMLKMFEGMFNDEEMAMRIELGIEGEHYDLVDKATSNADYIYQFKDEYTNEAARRLSGITDQMSGPSFFKPITIRKDFYMSMMTDACADWHNTYGPDETALADVFYKVDIIPSATDYILDMRKRQMALMAEIIQGKKSADSYMKEFAQIWSNGGGDVMLEEAKAHGETLETIYKEIGIK